MHPIYNLSPQRVSSYKQSSDLALLTGKLPEQVTQFIDGRGQEPHDRFERLLISSRYDVLSVNIPAYQVRAGEIESAQIAS